MRAVMWVVAATLFTWFMLAQNGVVSGPRGLVRTLRERGDAEPDLLPFCDGCPDHEACGQGGCYLDGGPVHPVKDEESPHRESHTCSHPGNHEADKDPNGIIGVSCEDMRTVHLSDEEQLRFSSQAWRDRKAAEAMRAMERHEDLSFLNGAGPEERQQWVVSWAGRHPDVKRSEIAGVLSRQAGVSLRQAQIDIRNALGPVAEGR